MTKENFPNSIEGYNNIINYLDENNIKRDKLVSGDVHKLYLTFIKFKGTKSERIECLNEIINFQKSANCPITVPSKPFDIVNKLVLKGHYSIALFLCSFASILYNNRKIKNIILRRFGNMKIKIE